jgi:O-antigen ligase
VRTQLEGAIQVLVAGVVLWVALAAGNVYPWNIPVGRIARWVALALLVVAALGYALTRRPRRASIGTAPLLAVVLLMLAFLSALWSSDAGLTAGRAASLLLLFVAAGALAYGSEGHPVAVGQILLGILAGAVAIAVGGLLNLWADPDRALVPATIAGPARYNGLGGNPNAMAMLLAATLPLAAWAFAEARSALGKAVAVAVFLLFNGSIVASGSRGAILAAFAGLLLLVPALARDRRHGLLLAGGAAALLIANVAVMEIPSNAERDPVFNTEFGQTRPIGPLDLQFKLPLESEIGLPTRATPQTRELLETSGRTRAWEGAVEQVLERPLLGYGFGTEERVFVDRYYVFLSDRVENSFLGTLLQLGIVGLAAFVFLLALGLVGGWRAVKSGDPAARRVAAACLGVVSAGLALALTQSFLTSVGSPATAPFWLAFALLTALAAGSGLRARPSAT